MQIIDLTGKSFERWTVLSFSHKEGKAVYWLCRCACGTERAVFVGDLKRGGSRSCGCLKREDSHNRLLKHGHSFHPMYRSWVELHARCNNKRKSGYELYGGRGISVDPSWNNFESFLADMGGGWAKGKSIDRIDVDGGYCKENCRWSSPKEQANNRRTNHVINTQDGPMNITQASVRFGIRPETIASRIRYGWPESDLLKPVRPIKHKSAKG
jgi:hypothetical protein